MSYNFLSPHPATVLWWGQRERCRACANHVVAETTYKNGSRGERCAVVSINDMHAVPLYEQHPNVLKPPKKTNRVGGHSPRLKLMAYCIDARLEGAPCGPDAKLFKEK